MTENKLTEKVIIKALECCTPNDICCCEDCVYYPEKYNTAGCISELMANALDLINRQQAEIERLSDLLKRNKRHTDRIRLITAETAKKIKSEAIKEFTAKLNETPGNAIEKYKINNIAKEVVGDDK